MTFGPTASNESLYDRALASGSVYLRYAEDAPPKVTRKDGQLTVRLNDLLTAGEEVGSRPTWSSWSRGWPRG